MTPPFADELRRTFEASGGRPLAQAATVSPGGLPEVRTVVLRGLGRQGEVWFASDARSAKIASLTATPWLELCLFDAAAGVQWRLLGRPELHAGDTLARDTWRGLAPPTRALFASAAPGMPLGTPAASAPGPRGAGAPARAAEPPASFVVVRLPPERCDRLVLGPPDRRRRWTRADAGWLGEDIAP